MNLQKMMKQAQAMQANMLAKQEQLAKQQFTADAANGKVSATANGAGELLELKIDPSIVDPEDVEFLQELIVTAVQEAIAKGKTAAADEMKSLTGGLNIPGL